MSRARLEGLSLLVLAFGYWRWAYRVPPFGVRDPVGPSAFPALLALVMAVAAVMLLLRPVEGEARVNGRPVQVIAIFTLLGLYALVFERLGFVASTVLFLSGTIALFAPAWRWRIPLYASLLTVALHVLFRWALGVSLPPGLIGL